MKFTIDPKELNSALTLAGVVSPEATVNGIAGYLFSVTPTHCQIYSRDADHVVRVQAPITDLEGEGSFVYPASATSSFKFVESAITLESVVEADHYIVKHATVDGEGGERSTVDPKLVADCEEDLTSAQSSFDFPVGVLQLALATVRPYLAGDGSNAQDAYKTLQIFDASKPEWAAGDGVMFAADNIRAAYFESSSFKGKPLAIYYKHLPYVQAYLAKAEGAVKVYDSAHMTYFVDAKESAIGVLHNVNRHTKYSYYPIEKDQYVFRIAKDAMLKPLQYIKAELTEKGRDKVRISYSKDSGEFRVAMSSSTGKSHSRPIRVLQCVQAEPADFAVNANIDHILDLFNSVQGNEVEFRISVVRKGTKDLALFRTIDHFWVGPNGKLVIDGTAPEAIECKVTRFVPSKD